MKLPSILLVILLGVTSGCATRTPMVIEPQSDVWEKVLASLPEDTRARLLRRQMASFDLSAADLPPPRSRRSTLKLDDLFAPDWDAIAIDWAQRFVDAPEKRVRIQSIVFEARMFADTGWDTPAVWLTVTWVDSSSIGHSETFYGAGVRYKGKGDTTKNPEAIFSEHVAFYLALAKAGEAVSR
jgi:hypothetical protein